MNNTLLLYDVLSINCALECLVYLSFIKLAHSLSILPAYFSSYSTRHCKQR